MSTSTPSPAPLRVAIVGAGPAGFYALEHLLKQDVPVEVDLLDQLPTPFGLVRGGVAPDHQKIKSVTRVFERLATDPRVRFLGHVHVGIDVTPAELLEHYHAVLYSVGAQTDRALGIPGEDLPGSHAATEFVGWYNGHPAFRDRTFDLSQRDVIVIGVGNVAVDVARILVRTGHELHATDIASHALTALAGSAVRHVTLVGRRGPAQAAFTTPELRELGELEGADCTADPQEATLDALSAEALAAGHDATATRNVEVIQRFARHVPGGKPRHVSLRFLLSPIALLGEQRVERVRFMRNRLVRAADGSLTAEPTGETHEMPAGLVFRSVGYKGVALPGLPFDARRGVIPNVEGRVVRAAGETEPLAGVYVAGWIKRGPSGVIGTNKPDAVQSAQHLLDDFHAGRLRGPLHPGGALAALLDARGVRVVSWRDWRRLDELETAAGRAEGRPRLKFTHIPEMLAALDRPETT